MQVPLTPSGSLKPSGLTPGELRELAQARLEDAEVLITAGRHSGAAYLCGYSVELSLKARICDTLGWQDYQIGKAFDSFKTHELKMLRELSGWKMKITTEYLAEWSAVEFWKPATMRYSPISQDVKPKIAIEMIQAAKTLIGVL